MLVLSKLLHSVHRYRGASVLRAVGFFFHLNIISASVFGSSTGHCVEILGLCFDNDEMTTSCCDGNRMTSGA